MTIRITPAERAILERLAGQVDPDLGSTPTSVVRALVREAGEARGLAAAPERKEPTGEVDPKTLQRRLRRFLRLYGTHVRDSISERLLVPLGEDLVGEISKRIGSGRMGLHVLAIRDGKETSAAVRRRVAHLLDAMDAAWTPFRLSRRRP